MGSSPVHCLLHTGDSTDLPLVYKGEYLTAMGLRGRREEWRERGRREGREEWRERGRREGREEWRERGRREGREEWREREKRREGGVEGEGDGGGTVKNKQYAHTV